MAAPEPTRNSQDCRDVPIKTEQVLESQNMQSEGFEKRGLQNGSVTVLDTSVAEEKAVAVPNAITVIEEHHEEQSEDDENHLSGFAMWMMAFALMFGVFVMALDNNIIATAIPRITSDFNSLDDVGWYGSAYLLFQMSLQPTYGKIYTYFNIKWTYITAVSLFEIGSIVIATAQNSPSLIVGRAIAGSGAAGIFSGSLIIIGHTVPLHRRPTFVAFVSSMYGVASVAGPLLGGVFTQSATLTWRFCFWINLPFGALAVILILIYFKNPSKVDESLSVKQKIAKIDLVGAFFLISGMVALLLALQWGGVVYPWSNSKVWGCMLAFVLLIIVFVVLQFRHENEVTIPLRIITHRTVAASCIFSCLLAMAVNTHAYYLPFYFQAIKGSSPSASGVRILPYLVSMTGITLVTGPSISRIGYYVPFLWVGATLTTIGSGLLFSLKVNSSVGEWIGYQILPGLGSGMAVQIPFIAVQVVLPKKDMPSGSGLVGFFNALGGAASISIAQNIFASKLLERLQKIPGLDASAVIAAGATNISSVVSGSLVASVREAYNYALTRAFILPIAVGAGALLASFAMHWRSVKEKPDNSRDAASEEEVRD